MQTYDRGTSATRLQSCFCWRWRVVSSRRPKENCLCNRKVPQLQQSSYQHEPKDVTRIWTWHTKTAAEKTHPSTLLPLGTTGQDETALQDDRPAACVFVTLRYRYYVTKKSRDPRACWAKTFVVLLVAAKRPEWDNPGFGKTLSPWMKGAVAILS